ncbi:MAG: hypothetical protein QXR62_04600 [Candidatus Bathyarchaeia archaeon]
MPIQIFYRPGTVSAGGSFTLPGYFPPLYKLLKVRYLKEQAVDEGGTATYTLRGLDVGPDSADKTIVDTTPDAGEVQLIRPRTIVVGDALTANDTVEIIAVTETEFCAP